MSERPDSALLDSERAEFAGAFLEPGMATDQEPGLTMSRPARPPVGQAIRYAIPHTLQDLDPTRHHVVEASAGTGKTYLIEHRVVDLLLTTDTLIEQILVVTFTEKATAELRFRVRRLLETVDSAREHTAAPDQPHWLIDDIARHRLSDALLGFDRAAILTIHAFCQRVLTENAFANRRLFAQTQVASEDAFGDAFKAALRQELARDPAHRPYLTAWHRSGKTVEDLEILLFRCANQHGRLVPDFDPDVVASRLRAACAEMPPMDNGGDGNGGAGSDDLLDAIKKAGVRGSSARAVLRRLAALRRCLDRVALDGDLPGFLALFEAEDRRISGSKERILPYLADQLQSADIAHAGLRAAQGVVLDLDTAIVPLAAAVAQRFLPCVLARMEAEKNRRGQFDFHDMLRLVWRSLEQDAGGGDAYGGELARRLRERYRHALIDEFQDTDELQWKIFRHLYLVSGAGNEPDDSADDSADDGVHDSADDGAGADANRLCIIGDPKQAIYSFRGADVFTYLQAKREVAEHGGQITNLIDNYRSTDALVRAYNLIFQDRFFTGDIRYDHPVRAATDLVARDARGAPVVPIHVFHVAPEQGKLYAESLRKTLLARIAEEIRGLLGEQAHAQPQHTGAQAHAQPQQQHARALLVGPAAAPVEELAPVHASDIFVLTRTTGESNEVADRLRQAGVPCAIYKQEGLFQTREAEEVRDLLCAVAEPRNRSARFKAWTTRFFGATLSDLPHLGDVPETHPLVARLYDWKGLADRLDYETLFSRILDDSGIIERELFLDTSERALTNFQHILEILLEEVMSARCELHELIQRLHRWISEPSSGQADDRNVQRLESERQAVQVMTIHRAKGLEAKVVFLYGGFGGFAGDEVQVYHDGDERLVHVGHAHRDIAAAVRRESQSEDQRLLYVAVTRAVARLYLPYASPDDYRMSGAYLQINRRLEEIVHRVHGGDPALADLFEVERVSAGSSGSARSAGRARILSQWHPPETLLETAPLPIDYDHARVHRAGFVVTSYTSMKGTAPATIALAGAPEAAEAPDSEGAGGPRDPGDPGSATGNAIGNAMSSGDPAGSAARAPGRAAQSPPRPGALSALAFKGDDVTTGVRAADDELPGGAQSGIFLHNVLEHVPFASAAGVDLDTWCAQPAIERLFGDAMLRFNRDPQHLRYSQRVVYRCLTTPLHIGRKRMPGLCTCERIMREVEFLYPIPTHSHHRPPPGPWQGDRQDRIRLERGYIKGFIDLIVELQGRVYLVDWKSDILADYSARAVARHVYREYQLQAQLYTIALARMLEIETDNAHRRRFGGLLYCFMRGMGSPMDAEGRQPAVYYVRPSLETLAELTSNLAERDDYR